VRVETQRADDRPSDRDLDQTEREERIPPRSLARSDAPPNARPRRNIASIAV